MKRTHLVMLTIACLALSTTVIAQALTFDDFWLDAPPCKQSKAKHPKLPADNERYYADGLRYDFNGDGWCDYAVAVPYPFNSQMSSYSIDELIILGGEKEWRRVLHGKKWELIDESKYPAEEYPLFQVDLTDIHLVYPKTGGPPYVLGLMASGASEPRRVSPHPPHCNKFNPDNVYRWDEAVGTLRKVGNAAAQIVIDYYYRFIAKPCKTEQDCRASSASCWYAGGQ